MMKECLVCGEKVADYIDTCPVCRARKFSEPSPVSSGTDSARSSNQTARETHAASYSIHATIPVDDATQKILSDLYAIRATMSIVAQNEEKVDDLEQKMVKKYEKDYWDDVVKRATSMLTISDAHYQVMLK